MRQIYTSPRAANIDRVVALMAEHGIATAVQNRSRYDRSTWKRYSYLQRHERREQWAQVWIRHPDDYTRARRIALLVVLAACGMLMLRYMGWL
jgi:hypothetical protein